MSKSGTHRTLASASSFRALSIALLTAPMWFAAPALAQQQGGEIDESTLEAELQGEIVITATRRETLIQDTPIAVTAVGAQQLENSGASDLRDLTQLTPSFQFNTGQSAATGSSAQIRGIGTAGDNPGFEPAVGIFIDGVYRSRAGTALGELPQIERVEILRGPQGTLFGRNTSSGAVNVITQGPTSEMSAYGEITVGDYSLAEARGGVSGPLVGETLLGRLDLTLKSRDGYITDVRGDRDLNDRNRWSVRGQLMWEPTPAATLRIIADMGETDEQCCAAVRVSDGVTAGAVNFIRPLGGVGTVVRGPDSFQTSVTPGRDILEAVEESGISGELTWDIGDMTLTSITAYRDWSVLRNQDIDFSDFDRAYREGYRNDINTFTQELRLQGEAGPVDWLVGAFYIDEDNALIDTIRFGAQGNLYVDLLANGATRSTSLPSGLQLFGTLGPTIPTFGQVALATNPGFQALVGANPSLAPLFLNPFPGSPAGAGQQRDLHETATQGWAVFTHNIIEITPTLDLTLGLRYNDESKDFTADLNSVAPTCDFFLQAIRSPSPAVRAAVGGLIQGLGDLALLSCNPAVNSEFNGRYADSQSSQEWTGTANLAWEPNDDLLLYAGYSRGFKAGGFNLDRSTFDSALPFTTTRPIPIGNGPQARDLAFRPEFTDAFEAGLKWTAPDRRTNINVAAFHQIVTDYQSLNFQGFNFTVSNVPEVISQGIEIEAATRPLDGLSLTGGVTWNSATYEDVSGIPAANPLSRQQGQQLPLVPEWSASGSITYEVPLADTGYSGLFYLDARFAGENDTSISRAPVTRNEATTILNGRLGLIHPDDSWRLELWVRNLTDATYFIGSFEVPEQTGSFAVYPFEPRTVGVTFRAGF